MFIVGAFGWDIYLQPLYEMFGLESIKCYSKCIFQSGFYLVGRLISTFRERILLLPKSRNARMDHKTLWHTHTTIAAHRVLMPEGGVRNRGSKFEPGARARGREFSISASEIERASVFGAL